MSGSLRSVWSLTWQEIWEPLSIIENSPEDLFCELYRELSKILINKLSIEGLADIIDNPMRSYKAFNDMCSTDIQNEPKIVDFFESAYSVIDEFGLQNLTDTYFILLQKFLIKFNIRYDLQKPCKLSPTLTGLFSSLISDLREYADSNPHLQTLMDDFDHAIRDLRGDLSDRRIRTCIQKQMNLLEAMGSASAGVTQKTLGGICDQRNDWPHNKVKESLKNLYSFACDYPGIRHGGTATSAHRTMGARDLISISILLAGFTPYLCDQLDPTAMYQGH
jgi:hypothetical protein